MHYADNTNVEKGDILQPLLLQHALWDYVMSETESRGNVKVEANIKLEGQPMFESKPPCSKPFSIKGQNDVWKIGSERRNVIKTDSKEP